MNESELRAICQTANLQADIISELTDVLVGEPKEVVMAQIENLCIAADNIRQGRRFDEHLN